MIVNANTGRNWLLFRNAAIFLAWSIGLVMCIRLALVRSYNYDEISHAHMAWLLSVGAVPYRDFAINHLPFFWVTLAPLIKVLPHAPVALLVLRLGALFLNAVFIAALGVLIGMELKPVRRIWAAACLGLFVTDPFVTQYLIELRPDALANALLFTSIAWLSSRRTAPSLGIFAAGFLISAALLVNTKYALFPFILGVTALSSHAYKLKRLHPMTFLICLGFGTALAAGLVTLSIIHVDIQDAWRMVVTYNAAVEKIRPFGFGVATALAASPFLLLCSGLGLIGCCLAMFSQKLRPRACEVAAFVFLLVFILTTTRPWKQYAVSWVLLAALFPSRIGAMLATRLSPKTQFFAASGVLAISISGFLRPDSSDPNATGDISRNDQEALIHFCSLHLEPDDYVLAGFPLHPVFWRDSFYKVVIDMQAKGGDSLEEIMPRLDTMTHKERWEQSGYENELEQHPPSLIVMPPLITEAQSKALSIYLRHHASDYQCQTIPDSALTVSVRRHDLR